MIDLERWLEIKQIVQEVLDLPGEERSAYLSRACGDDEQLRREVEALLAVSATHAEIIDNYQVLPVSVRKATLTEGDEVGPYRIIRPLGEGGMGAVYLAHDTRLDRSVALKTVPRRSERVLRDEQRLLAKLQHPNIAALYDSGVTEDGFGYFIMEYIEGDPITTYCETHKLSIRERLELFLPVCDAVSVAHRGLIVHRDIKPSNILVTNDGTPKLLDFGIAKLLHPELVLQPEAPSFTPPFASPEQLEGEHTTTATDIYSLGVLLCLLLTGRLPYPVKSYGDLPWAIRNMEPEKPSQLVLRNNVGLGADARPAPVPLADSQKRARILRGDLDAIVLRALQKKPDERYQLVNELAEDIRRFMNKEPVSARGKSRRYYLLKFWQRRHWSIIGVTSVFLALSILSLFLIRENREATRQRDLAKQQAQRAEEVTQFLVELFDRSSLWPETGAAQTPEHIVDAAAARLQTELSAQPQLRGRLLLALAEIYARLGSYSKAEPLIQTALTLHRQASADNVDVGHSLNALGALRYYQGRYEEAESLYDQALSIFRRHSSDDVKPLVSGLNNLATLKIKQGDMSEAERLARESLAICAAHPQQAADRRDRALRLLSNALQNQDRLTEAEAILKEVIKLRKNTLGPTHPDTALAISDLATLAHDNGDHVEEERLHREALRMLTASLPPDNPQLITTLGNLAGALSHLSRFTEAEALHREVLARRKHVLGNKHPLIGVSINNLAHVISQDEKRRAEAVDLFKQALPIMRDAYGPESREVSIGLNNIASTLTLLGQYDEAESTFREALDVSIRSFGENATDTAYTLRSYGNLKLKQEQYAQAQNLLNRSLKILHGKLPADHLDIAYTEVLYGASLAGTERFNEAEELMLPAFDRMQKKETRIRRKTEALQQLAALYEGWGKPEKAAKYRKQLADLKKEWEAQQPGR